MEDPTTEMRERTDVHTILLSLGLLVSVLFLAALSQVYAAPAAPCAAAPRTAGPCHHADPCKCLAALPEGHYRESRTLDRGEVILYLKPAEKGTLLSLSHQGIDGQPDVTTTFRAWLRGPAGKSALKLQHLGRGFWGLPLELADGQYKLSVEVNRQNRINLVEYSFVMPLGAKVSTCPMRAAGKCPGGQCAMAGKCTNANCPCGEKCRCGAACKCEPGKCQCPAGKPCDGKCSERPGCPGKGPDGNCQMKPGAGCGAGSGSCPGAAAKPAN